MMKRVQWLVLVISIVLLAGCDADQEDEGQPEEEIVAPTAEIGAARLTPLAAPAGGPASAAVADSNIAHIWANDGGDKVTRDELRAASDANGVLNSVWNGSEIVLFGARNEVVSFNLVLEAPAADAIGINVELAELIGPDQTAIATRPASGDDLFNYVGRNIELFYVRYLQILGISTDLFYAGFDYDERHIPSRCRRPHDAEGEGTGGWEDRPCHGKFYPDIAVPLELEAPFTIEGGRNQSIWGDVYIPRDVPAGEYVGTITITENGTVTWQIPIRLQVRDFALPDLPNARTMLYYSIENLNDLYFGRAEIDPNSAAYAQSLALADRHFQMAHRHKISLIDDYTSLEQMNEAWLDRLSGDLFTLDRGYAGVGAGVGNNVYSIGTYQSWPWTDGDEADMWVNTDAWVSWFENHPFSTPTDTFLYVIDEPEFNDETPLAERWAGWMNNNPGPGQALMSLVTISLPTAVADAPSVDIPTFWAQFGLADQWAKAADNYRDVPGRRLYAYNSNRPATGSFGIEDDGIALRVLAWTQYKMGIDRWFYWESTYYDNFQGEMGPTNVFQQAHTFGSLDDIDDVLGETGWNYLNGDGVLLYPGTDRRFPQDSYDVMGPIASLRLKQWRRGIQDVDYLVMAAEIDPDRTAEIVQALVPRVLWEVGVSDPDDPTYVLTDVSWPADPDLWEAARAELADLIEGAGK